MLDKKYDHKKVEEGKYEKWIEKGYFKSGNLTKKPYCIILPPPNVTGKLHLGHAWDGALQDIIIRYKKMEGYDCLWLPGMDHAAIATEAKVVKKLKDEGKDKHKVGREEFLKECWNWTNTHGDIIRKQWAKLGLALDYSKERFTLDEGIEKAVKKVFVDFYNKGLIYRGEKIINWDPVAQTALSNEEVSYAEEKSAFYHLKYKLVDSDEYIDVATTRPETLFGDTAVAVNENDERYKKFIGKKVILPIVNRQIPIITDEHADMEKGTGAVKITPASNPNDFEVGNRHNLERINIMNDDATMNENCGKYQGMTREECREKLVEKLKEEDLLINIEPITHEVGHSERTGAIIEPMIKKQWFVKMRPLADQVLKNQKDSNTKVHFVPSSYEKTMNHWMEITYDWCISRQLWWGHRIPAWYKDEEVYVGMEKPEGEGWVQESDVLDTWFSSALWPFATLGFLLWGMGIFVLIVIEKLWIGDWLHENRLVGHLYVLSVTPIMWLTFVMTDWQQYKLYLRKMFPLFAGNENVIFATDYLKYLSTYGVFFIAGFIFITAFPKKLFRKYHGHVAVKGLLTAVFILSVYCMYRGLNDPFLYFRF